MLDFADLVQRANALAVNAPPDAGPAGNGPGSGMAGGSTRRAILGITGPPGSGKSTLAGHLVATLRDLAMRVAQVPMDGFHLADSSLRRLGIMGRKGAIDTFDAYGYLALLERLRARPAHTVYAPDFERDLEQPIAAGIAVEPQVDLVITEGNYFLAPTPPWPAVRAAMDEVWYCELPESVRTDRLVARHTRFGKAPDAAREWVAKVDQANADEVAGWRSGADLHVDVAALGLAPLDL
ncbi:MAG: nucleoside/nucleotide kinase family protein [Bifidobacteriaceae bacterium]|nr:nucleoside/nucleotide kinase family protein [Bifidobacteriaceae bacterium]